MGDFDAAATLFREASANAARVFGEDSRRITESHFALVPLEIEIGDLTAAIADARRAIEIYFKEGEPGSATHAGESSQTGERPPRGAISDRSRAAARRSRSTLGASKSQSWTHSTSSRKPRPCTRAARGASRKRTDSCDRRSTRAARCRPPRAATWRCDSRRLAAAPGPKPRGARMARESRK